MKTVVHLNNEAAASACRERLAEAGIESWIKRENIALDVAGDIGQSRVTIFVDDKDYDRAMEICRRMEKEREEAMPWCEKCGSEDVECEMTTRRRGKWWWGVIGVAVIGAVVVVSSVTASVPFFVGGMTLGLSLIVATFLPYSTRRYRCRSCGHEFRRH